MKSTCLFCLAALAVPTANAFAVGSNKGAPSVAAGRWSSPSLLWQSAEESTPDETPEETVMSEEKTGDTDSMTAVVEDESQEEETAVEPVVEENSNAQVQKQKLLELLGKTDKIDPVLADPITKEPLTIDTSGVFLADPINRRRRRVSYKITSDSNEFAGSSDTYLNLLEPVEVSDNDTSDTEGLKPPTLNDVFKVAMPYIPPPLRSPLANIARSASGSGDDESMDEYIPMRDLFTSPAVSFAYERGWRQGFAQAGFPGADVEARMAMDYFAPVVAKSLSDSVVIDMSCATGLFTRRFAATDEYARVLGCDYSDSMLQEARRRITLEPNLQSLKRTQLELVRLDVGQLPFQTESIDCLHAGAAMHCWPDLDAAASEIYRSLKPGGRYFATTFLSTYFSVLSGMDGASSAPSQQAFQYFESVDRLKDLLVGGGFEPEKVNIEVLGTACVVIRAEK